MCFHFLSIPKLRPKGTGTSGAANTNNSKFVSLVDVDHDLKSYVLIEKGILPRSERLSNFDCFPFFFSKLRRQNRNIFPVQEIKRSRTDDFNPGTLNMIYSNSKHRKGTSQPGRQLKITSHPPQWSNSVRWWIKTLVKFFCCPIFFFSFIFVLHVLLASPGKSVRPGLPLSLRKTPFSYIFYILFPFCLFIKLLE